jgi:hypothetical protein
MFWTVIRWGGSAAIILLVLAAVLLSGQGGDGATVVPAEQGDGPTPVEIAPADSAPQQNKNFNL